ncbi:MAG: sensor histidine kinase N-terminal domain-containing protein [Phycisphaerae bacterium]|nr:sensor histidine kinase N-terminal domain-containing protein [Phycisphaerae bacterium]
MKRSLRRRLLAGIIGGILLLLAVFSLLVYVVIRGALLRQFDESLASVAQVLAASVELDGNDVELEFEARQMPEFQDVERPTRYQFWDANGAVVAKSPLSSTQELRRPETTLKNLVFQTSRDESGQPQRSVGLKFAPRIADSDETQQGRQKDEELFTLVVARDASDLHSQLGLLRWLLVNASAAVVILSLIFAAVVVRQGLHPLNSIAAEIAAISEENLATRIASENVPAEVIPIKNRLNELLCRLEASFKKERRFNADIAHELRTPLAGIRSTIEVALARNRDPVEYRQALEDCLEIAGSMQAVVGNLLMLTRLEARQISLETDRIRLAGFIDSAWQPFSDKAMDRNITFDNRIEPDVTFESDRANLGTVLSNVLCNAVEYVDDSGRIWVTARSADDSIEIAVSNTGCHLTSEQVSQVFDCFWRVDSSRSDTGAHCGLGLALVQRLVGALGGRAAAVTEPGGIFSIRLILPASP